MASIIELYNEHALREAKLGQLIDHVHFLIGSAELDPNDSQVVDAQLKADEQARLIKELVAEIKRHPDHCEFEWDEYKIYSCQCGSCPACRETAIEY